MVNKKTTISVNEESADEKSAIAKMRAVMYDLRRQNQTLEDNILHIQQHQQKTDPTIEVEMLDPGLSLMRYANRLFWKTLSCLRCLSSMGATTHINMYPPSTCKRSSLELLIP